jgi:hypothetical protein
VSPDEAWLVGFPMSICHWTRDAGLVETAVPTIPTLYLNDVYVTPAGEVYAAGGEYSGSDGTCLIFREDGTQLSVPSVVDNYYDDGCNSIDGTGTQVYALARSNANQRGVILHRVEDGGFEQIYEAPYRLSLLDVDTTGEVWAVGATGQTLIYFDGGSWGEVALPLTENRPNVFLENVAATTDGVIITGYERENDGGLVGIVNTYRKRGR